MHSLVSRAAVEGQAARGRLRGAARSGVSAHNPQRLAVRRLAARRRWLGVLHLTRASKKGIPRVLRLVRPTDYSLTCSGGGAGSPNRSSVVASKGAGLYVGSGAPSSSRISSARSATPARTLIPFSAVPLRRLTRSSVLRRTTATGHPGAPPVRRQHSQLAWRRRRRLRYRRLRGRVGQPLSGQAATASTARRLLK